MIDNGKALGSGGFKKYDESSACLTYLYIEPSEEYKVDELYLELYQKLVNDIRETGLKSVFVLCENDQCEFYRGLGYYETEERDKEKLADLMVVYVTHDKTMIKDL